MLATHSLPHLWVSLLPDVVLSFLKLSVSQIANEEEFVVQTHLGLGFLLTLQRWEKRQGLVPLAWQAQPQPYPSCIGHTQC